MYVPVILQIIIKYSINNSNNNNNKNSHKQIKIIHSIIQILSKLPLPTNPCLVSI